MASMIYSCRLAGCPQTSEVSETSEVLSDGGTGRRARCAYRNRNNPDSTQRRRDAKKNKCQVCLLNKLGFDR